jgi:hypothetical protein
MKYKIVKLSEGSPIEVIIERGLDEDNLASAMRQYQTIEADRYAAMIDYDYEVKP